jgi:hypothetical protein
LEWTFSGRWAKNPNFIFKSNSEAWQKKMKAFRVPCALTENGRLVSPKVAVKGQGYRCPRCLDPLIFRKGNINVPHFAHKGSASCSGETILHFVAKMLIKQVICEWIAGNGDIPLFMRRCCICGDKAIQPLPSIVTGAELERKTNTGFIVDV